RLFGESTKLKLAAESRQAATRFSLWLIAVPAVSCRYPVQGDRLVSEPLFPDVGTATQPDEEVKVRLLPPYHVILLNDEHHSFEFVIEVLRKALGFNEEHAFLVTKEAH